MPFETACGSVIGTAHLRAGRNGQDGWAIERDDDGCLVLVVTDGCGSAQHSEVGAKLGARLVAREILARAHDNIDWREAAAAVAGQLEAIAVHLDVTEHLLFTIAGAVITDKEVVVFHAGDGLFAINDAVRILGPYPDNAPPYLAHALLFGSAPDFTIAHRGPVENVQSILVATDGAAPLVLSGELTGLTRVSRNPDAIRRRLFLLTRPGSARLDDDTTIAMARRTA